jgi:hypothetical protein
LKAVLFVPIVARLAIELGVSFVGEEEIQRGGLLTVDFQISGRNVLQLLMMNYHFINQDNNTEHHRLIDNVFLTVMIRLREMGLLKKEDICDYELVSWICGEGKSVCGK